MRKNKPVTPPAKPAPGTPPPAGPLNFGPMRTSGDPLLSPFIAAQDPLKPIIPAVAGLDISFYQPKVNWKEVLKAGFEFCIAKASDGVGTKDSMFDTHRKNATENGIIFGAYHFMRFGGLDAKTEAANFLKYTGGVRKGELPLTLDIEWDRKNPKYDESSAYPLKSADTGSTAVARTGADSDTLETLSDQVDTVTTNVSTLLSRVTSTLFSGITSLAAWLRGLARTSTMDTTAKAELNASAGSYDESTDSLQALGDAMDQCTVTVVSGVDGDTITVVPYTTWEFTVSGMATLAGAAENGVVFTVKNRATDSDDNAILQVQETVGLVRLNGAAGTAGKATLTVAESETALTVHVNASQTGSVAPGSLHWDVKMVVTPAEDADQMARGVFEVSDPAVTRMLTL